MQDPALIARLKIALRSAEAAGAVLMRHLGHLRRIDHKALAHDLVTDADRESEVVLLAELRAAFPGDGFLAEESDGNAEAERMRDQVPQMDWCWVIDPLDGTTNFTHGYKAFCVSVGLLRRGRPVLGVVLAPARREVFIGGEGVAPTCNGQRIQVSTVGSFTQSLVGTGFPYDRRQQLPQLLTWVGRVLERTQGLRRSGSAALDLSELAAGRLDAFYEPGLKPWDLAAGVALVEAAGGRVTAFDGTEHDLFAANTLASNGLVHADLQDLVHLADGAALPV